MAAKHGYGAHARVSSRSRAVRKHHPVRNTLLVLLFLLLCAAGAAGIVGYKFYQQAMQVKDHEMQAVQLLQSVKDMDKLQSADAIDQILPELQTHTAAAKKITQGNLWQYAARLPKYGADVQTLQGMTVVVDDVTNSTVPKLSSVMKTLLATPLSQGNGKVNLQPIVDAQNGFTDVNALLGQQLEQLRALPQPVIPQIKDAYDQSVSQFEQLTNSLQQANDAMQVLPQFLGVDGARTYVIVAQTTSEARSSGGLIGSLGTMTANNGSIAVGDFHPNAEFEWLQWGGSSDEESLFDSPLNFRFDVRDITAAPDMSRVAKRVSQIWKLSPYATQVDGVMMIDPVFIQEMVKISGNITLDNGTKLTGKNTAEYLLNTIYKDVPIAKQDYYFEYVAKSAMNNMLTGMKIDTMMKMAKAIGTLAEQRHLYMYTFHDDEAANFQGAGLAKDAPSSEENPEVGIYLNQQNASKLDWYIKRKTVISHTGANADGSQNYHVSFTMTNSLSKKQAQTETWYIVGGHEGIGSAGESIERMLFYGPAGGSISNLTASGSGTATKAEKATLNGKSLMTSVSTLNPGESITYEFDVTTSPKATAQLAFDQTPMGWADPGVEYKY